jgi:fused signal recognition particle receptor
LLRADVGIKVTDGLLEPLRARVKAKEITEPDALLAALRENMKASLSGANRSLTVEDRGGAGPNVWLFVGVNGVGKTTTIGKVAAQQRAEGRKVLLAAGDTFRAAAAEQLQTWAQRSGAEFVRGNEGGDPSAVIFDGVQAGASRGCDIVLGDTAGRLQNKSNLMEELRKVRRVADREPGKVTEVLLVIDATTGQNGLVQAKEFGDVTEVTGVVLTKLDGSAKGGIVFAIETELGLPVKLVGLGETIGDLVPFDPDESVDALFAE